MPKAKLKLEKGLQKKLAVAAEFADVKLESFVVLGNNMVGNVNFRQPSQLVELGRYLETVTGDEVIATAATPAPKKK